MHLNKKNGLFELENSASFVVYLEENILNEITFSVEIARTSLLRITNEVRGPTVGPAETHCIDKLYVHSEVAFNLKQTECAT